MSRRWKRILLVAGALIGVFAIVAGSWAWRVANSFRDENTSFTQVIKSYTDPRSEFPNTSKLTLLVLGQDYNHDRKGMIYTKGSRADTIMMLSVDLDEKTINAVSVPRDTYVEATDGRSGKINGTFARGGVNLTKSTIERMFHVSIDHYVLIKPDAVREIVNSVGGVDVETIDQMKYDDNWAGLHIDLPKGPQHIDGQQAVGFVRFREVNRSRMDNRGRIIPIHNVKSSLEEGDIRRTARQQQLIRALVASANTPTNIWKADSIIQTAFGQIITDLTKTQILALTRIFKGSNGEGMKSATLPGTDDMSSGAYYWKLDDARAQSTVDWLIKGNDIAGKRLIRVSIQNGTDVNGAAKAAAELVGKTGYDAEANGNAKSKSTKTLVTYSKATFAEAANDVARLLGAPAPQKVPEKASPYHPEIEVVIGADLAASLVPKKPSARTVATSEGRTRTGP